MAWMFKAKKWIEALTFSRQSAHKNNAVFWDAASCISCINRRFGGMYRLYLQDRRIRDLGTSVSRWLQRSRIFLPWRWRRYIPPKRRLIQDLHGATSQKTAFFIVTAVNLKSYTVGSQITVRLSALRAGRPLTPPGKFLIVISVRGWVDPRAIVRLEGLGKLKKSTELIVTRTRDLPACSIVPQPTTLPRASCLK
jgi:hypothetical protein